MIIEPIEYAPKWIRHAAAKHAMDAKAYAWFRVYNSDPVKHPALRDRTSELIPAVTAMAGGGHATIVTNKGYDLQEFGFEPVGAEFAQVYRLIFV